MIPELRPGDILLYKNSALVSWWIRFKTWSDVNHCETYIGDGKVAAARGPYDGTGGVNTYDVRLDNLRFIVRPNQPFDIEKMIAWHQTTIGQKYDLWGVVRVFYLGGDGKQDRMFCSEHSARMAKLANGGPGMFAEDFDCDEVSPGMILSSPHYNIVYDSKQEGA